MVSTGFVLLLAEDDDGHATLVEKNLRRAGLENRIIRFKDGQEILDFLFSPNLDDTMDAYLVLLDIRMPRVDGMEVLRRIKSHKELKKIPVIILTTTDDPLEIARCHQMGCSSYITKPVEYEMFVKVIRQLGLFMSIVQVPGVNLSRNGGME